MSLEKLEKEFILEKPIVPSKYGSFIERKKLLNEKIDILTVQLRRLRFARRRLNIEIDEYEANKGRVLK